MTEASHRLLDAWSPPPGSGEPILCIATSYTFDQEFFEGQCLGRFLGLDSVRGEDDLWVCLIENEERLTGVSVHAIVDRGESPVARNLRWDLLPGGVPGGLMHAKVSLLVWQNLVRVIIGSANLTPVGYRSQVEASCVLDAHTDSKIPGSVFEQAFDALEYIVAATPGTADDSPPKQRVLESVARARQQVAALRLPPEARTGPFLSVVTGGAKRPVLPGIKVVWRGSVPRWASVMSPFFDSGDGGSPAARALADELARRGDRSIRLVFPCHHAAERTIVYAPKAITTSLPEGIEPTFETYDAPSPEPRRLHAKAVVLESARWVAGLIGSSNFTAKGLGLDARPHVEVNLAIGASVDSDVGTVLLGLIPGGDAFEPDDVEWQEQNDEDEGDRPAVPWGFREALLRPGANPELVLVRLGAEELPPAWRLDRPSGETLLDSAAWLDAGSDSEVVIPLEEAALFWIQVHWTANDSEHSAAWPLNVTDPALLPPPEELRGLSAESLLEVLASSRPIHEAIANLLRREEARSSLPRSELDPLRRFSDTGQLLHRARRLSAALSGLQRRLERPAASIAALEWRISGPLGPTVLARKLIDESEGERMVSGELGFSLAELALTISRVDWNATASILGMKAIEARVEQLTKELDGLRRGIELDGWLKPYVDRAFAKARS